MNDAVQSKRETCSLSTSDMPFKCGNRHVFTMFCHSQTHTKNSVTAWGPSWTSKASEDPSELITPKIVSYRGYSP